MTPLAPHSKKAFFELATKEGCSVHCPLHQSTSSIHFSMPPRGENDKNMKQQVQAPGHMPSAVFNESVHLSSLEWLQRNQRNQPSDPVSQELRQEHSARSTSLSTFHAPRPSPMDYETLISLIDEAFEIIGDDIFGDNAEIDWSRQWRINQTFQSFSMKAFYNKGITLQSMTQFWIIHISSNRLRGLASSHTKPIGWDLSSYLVACVEDFVACHSVKHSRIHTSH